MLCNVYCSITLTSACERAKLSDWHARSHGASLLYLSHTVQKDSRVVLGTSFRFGLTSEILENIQYGGSSVVENS